MAESKAVVSREEVTSCLSPNSPYLKPELFIPSD